MAMPNAKRGSSPTAVNPGASAASVPAAESPRLRHSDEAVATILARDAYARERHYLLIRVIMGLLIALGCSSASNLYLATRPPVNHYFATSGDGRLMQLTPVNRPIGSEAELNTWTANSVVQAYTFSFANYRAEQSAAQKNFTPQGWRSFQLALRESNLLQTVIDERYVTTAAPTGAPVLLDSGLVEGRYAYKLQMPMVVTYQSSARTTSQNLMMDIIVVRQPETDNPRGLGIAQLLAH